MPKKTKRPGWDVEGVSDLLEGIAKMTGMRFQKIRHEDGREEMFFTAPIHPQTIPLILGALPGALFEKALKDARKRIPKAVPPNDKFEGKKRF